MNRTVVLAIMLLLTGTLLNGVMVKADDDEEHKYKYEYDGEDDEKEENDDDEYEEYDDDDEYDEYEYESGDRTDVKPFEKGTWNIWTRTLVGDKADVPFTNSKSVQLKIDSENTERDIYIIPKEGELFVPGKTVAQFLEAEATMYEASRILLVKYQDTKLIFRSSTNVVYDNNVKTPLPANAFYLNGEVYLPISVMANGLGYAVEWQEEKNMFLCRKLSD
ncbi:copper amine oxidase N-terminal domain-containing protein [Viridibacillus sp. YIM B01967]|uniref:Copper amine oxidase N-terminal domain-containing protein n=1 Tax=Viridibacillus soli TaxID=2798301 RepID=A0ABS1HDB7_9BACL|nr:copper amine oxidase N-terminal domain-containing protein [Viridibacillus soli]MBK3497404.1 copper amine oxidase N-terminal domain-containing protein [Viridibacillus soli]